MKKETFEKVLKQAVEAGWFKKIQLEFTKNYALNQSNGDASYIDYERDEYSWDYEACISSFGRAYIAKEFLQTFNMVVEEIYAGFDESYGPRLSGLYIVLRCDSNWAYEIDENCAGYDIVKKCRN